MIKKLLLLAALLPGLSFANPIEDLLKGTAPAADFQVITVSEHHFKVELPDQISTELAPYSHLSDYLTGLTDKDYVELVLHNLGGSSITGNILIGGMLKSKAHITAHIQGIAASMGALIACSAEKIDMDPASMLMFHNGSAGIEGKPSSIQSQNDAFIRQNKLVLGNCKKFGFMTDKIIEDIQNGKDYWFLDTDLKQYLGNSK